MQVNSPRNVLSELLQNAEDTGATWARCEIKDSAFIFEHNGEDFNEESLRSLCRFGYSNKRVLHTIGFRGIGFKTTFSLGPAVIVETPTLSFQFHKERFTLPVWLDADEPLLHTRIRVFIDDPNCLCVVQDNLCEWLASPVPLLFFSNIATLEISGKQVRRNVLEAGPVPGSHWMQLDAIGRRLLKIRSEALMLPDATVAEIRAERGDPTFEPGVCFIEMVYGLAENRLYTVLPTQVMPRLPFSCNAPFVQDPSRYRIKDPAISPTNRWLLEQIGRMAGTALCEWLQDARQPVALRVKAYGLLPSYKTEAANPLDEAVRQIVCKEMQNIIQAISTLISHDETMSSALTCADIPAGFVEAWGTTTSLNILDQTKGVCLHSQVSEAVRGRLAEWSLLKRGDGAVYRNALNQAKTLPRPDTDEGLITLWAAVEDLASSTRFNIWSAFDFPIVPVRGSDQLYRTRDLVRMVAKEERLSPEDRSFLFGLVKIADSTFLHKFESTDKEKEGAQEDTPVVTKAAALFRRLKFETSSYQRVFEMACDVFSSEEVEPDTCFRLMKIAVKADLSVSGTAFQYVCRDGAWRTPFEHLLFSQGRYDDLLPDDWMEEHCISDRYAKLFSTDEKAALSRWLSSTKSDLNEFPIPDDVRRNVYDNSQVRALVVERSGTSPDFNGAGHTWSFTLHDFDWDTQLVAHWTDYAKEDDAVWCRVISACAATWALRVQEFAEARIDRPRGAARYSVSDRLTAAWLHRLQSLPCLPEDKSRTPELPSLLLRRSPNTESLLNIEKFVLSDLDNEQTRSLLDLLGVRSEPTNADKVMQRLHALAETAKPPLTNLLDLYRALDGTLARLGYVAQAKIRSAFDEAALIYDSDGSWQCRSDIFQNNDDEVPGVSIVHQEMRSLNLWMKLGVSRYPNLEAVMVWLTNLPSHTELSDADRRRVVAILLRSPRKALELTGHWLTCAGTWTPWVELHYFVSGPRSEGRGDTKLFKYARQKVADFGGLSQEQIDSVTEALVPLRDALTYDIDAQGKSESATPDWMRELAMGLFRIESPNVEEKTQNGETAHIQDIQQAVKLFHSRFTQAQSLAVRPYLDGVQVGADNDMRALWRNGAVYVVGSEHAHHRSLVEQLEGQFLAREFRQAIGDCIGRPAEWIRGYFQDTFKLRSLEEAERDLGLHNAVADQFSLHTSQDESEENTQTDYDNNHAEKCDEKNGAGEFFDEDSGKLEDEQSGMQEREQENARRIPPRLHPLQMYLAEHRFIYDDIRQLYARPVDGMIVRRETGSAFWVEYDMNGEERRRYLEVRSPLREGIVLG